MSFLIILLIILAVIFWPVIRTFWAISRATRQARRGFTSAREEQRRQQQQAYARPQRKKIFRRDEGEYVDYEEITVTSRTTASDTGDTVSYEVEQQVVDAEWEEIK